MTKKKDGKMNCNLHGKNKIKDLVIKSLEKEYQEVKQRGDVTKTEQVREELHSLRNGVLGKILDKVPT